jgi:hypothetical protein
MRLGSALYWFVVGLAWLTPNCGSTDDQGLFNGSGGGGNAAGASGSSAGVFGNSGTGFGGTGGSVGTGGSGEPDSAPDTGGFGGSAGSFGTGGQPCDQYCGDGDGDGHGDPTKRPTSCENLGSEWVTVCDDCHDGNPNVFPGATTCKAEPYVQLDGGTPSFDYDCSGSETECGEAMKAAASCSRTLTGCNGGGYLTSQPEGGGPSPYCGSTRFRVCNPLGPICTPTTEMREALTCL